MDFLKKCTLQVVISILKIVKPKFIDLGNYKRESLEGFPKVFKTCICKDKKDESKSINFTIQEVPIELHNELIEFMVKYYLPDEPLARTSGVINDPVSLEVYKFLFYQVLIENLSIVALTDDENGKSKIIGCQLYTVSTPDDDIPAYIPGVAMQKLVKFLDDFKTMEILKQHNIKTHLQDWGLCVDPKYRGWGIGEEILQCGNDLAKHINLNLIVTIFTVINSQVLAQRLGYKEIHSLIYKEYKDEAGNLIFPGEDKTEAIKLMIMTL